MGSIFIFILPAINYKVVLIKVVKIVGLGLLVLTFIRFVFYFIAAFVHVTRQAQTILLGSFVITLLHN